MASGALPPAFPAVRIDGEPYWDGGVYSNTPIEAVLDDKPRATRVIFAVHVWNPSGNEPQVDLASAGPAEGNPVRQPRRQPRARQKQIHRLRHVIRQLAQALAAGQPNAAAKCRNCFMGLPHDDARRAPAGAAPRGEDYNKDIDFTPAGIR